MRALALLCGTVLASVASAQLNPALQCTANVTAPPIVRMEGITELVGDIVLACTGGTPTAVGKPIPTANITVVLNTAVTSRLLGNGLNEAVLVIDEPRTTINPNAPLVTCTKVAGCGGALGGATYGSSALPNVYAGLPNSPNGVTWLGVPIDPPGSTSNRIIRVTNVRANANQLGLDHPHSLAQILASIQIPGSTFGPIPVKNSQLPVATAQPALVYSTAPGSFQYCAGSNGNSLFAQNTPGATGPAVIHVLATEQFPNAFKPPGSTQQNIPGVLYNTESGFAPGVLGIGLANYGTTLQGTLTGVPQGVSATIPSQVSLMHSFGTAEGLAFTQQTSLQADALGNATFSYQVIQRTGSDIVSLDVPITLTGSPSQNPAYIQSVFGFANTPYQPTTLFAPSSPLLNGIPLFGQLDPAISNPAGSLYQQAATIVPCTNSGNTLSLTNPAQQPTFVAVTDSGGTVSASVIAPRLSNVGLVSTLLPTPNITVVKDPSATWLNVSLNQTTTPATASLSVNAASVGSHSTTLSFSSPSGSVSVPVSYTVVPGPWFTEDGFDNSASYVSNVVAPGEPFVIFGGDNFGPAQIALPALGPDGRALSLLGNTQVLFDGVPAPLYYSVDASGTGQVAGFAPFALDGKAQTNVEVVYNGIASPPVTLPVLDAVPGLFTADSSGGGQGSILNQNQSINGPGNPESVGNVIVLYGGGAGQTNPPGRDGALAGVGAPVAQLKLPVQVFIDGIQATDIPYAGPAPGLVEGVFQINVRIPAGVRSNANVPVLVQIEDKQTQPGVTVSTR